MSAAPFTLADEALAVAAQHARQRDAAMAQRDAAMAERDVAITAASDALAQVAALTSLLADCRADRDAYVVERDAAEAQLEALPKPIAVSITCPYCIGGDALLLGTLGRAAHYRCRACGGQSFVTLF